MVFAHAYVPIINSRTGDTDNPGHTLFSLSDSWNLLWKLFVLVREADLQEES